MTTVLEVVNHDRMSVVDKFAVLVNNLFDMLIVKPGPKQIIEGRMNGDTEGIDNRGILQFTVNSIKRDLTLPESGYTVKAEHATINIKWLMDKWGLAPTTSLLPEVQAAGMVTLKAQLLEIISWAPVEPLTF